MSDEKKNQPSSTVPNFFADRRKLTMLLGIGVAVIVLMIFSGVDGDSIATIVGIFFWAGLVIIGKVANKRKSQMPIVSAILSKSEKPALKNTSNDRAMPSSKSHPTAFSEGDKTRAIVAAVGVLLILLVGVMFYIAK